MKEDLRERLLDFSVGVIRAVRTLPRSTEYRVISYQIIKSATSVGANYEESQAAVSKADFSNKVGIAPKEARETNYWLKVLLRIVEQGQVALWEPQKKESVEITKILGSIHSKVRH